MEVSVLRLGHRFSRDKRISTHLALTARAFGASEIIYDARDPEIEESVNSVVSSWGGDFRVAYTSDWRETVREFDGVRVHLTMYGLKLDETISKIGKSNKNVLVVVGGAKVPKEMYELVDFNLSVGAQPHSEVAALAVFLDRFFEGNSLYADFEGGRKIIPQACGKKIVEP